MNKIYTVRYRLTIRGILTGDDMKVIAPTKHHAIELVRHLINIDCMQTHFDDVHLDCQVVDETEDPPYHLIKGKERAMRAIKFRVWFKPLQKMYTINGMTFDASTGDVYGVHFPVVYFAARGDIELMQFTGLRDRLGKEIYEGDIVDIVRILTTIPTQPFDARGLITYTAPEFHASGHSLQGYEYEVIGNIYENPELFY